MGSLVVSDTPFELYDVDGVEVHVKREDLCCPYPGPALEKARGVLAHMASSTHINFGVLDASHSRNGWCVAYIANGLGKKCYDFYPRLKCNNGSPGPSQVMAQSHGAILIEDRPLKAVVLWVRARKYMVDIPDSEMLPSALKLSASVDEVAKEISYTPKELLHGTWVVSVGTGTLASGVLKGLGNRDVIVYLHMGYTRSVIELQHYVEQSSGVQFKGKIIDEGFTYKECVDNTWIPFPCNPYYDAKAFGWLCRNVKSLRRPIVFWNIGA